MTLLFLLPGDPSPPGCPDPDFAREARAARAAGAHVAAVGLDALCAGDAARAVAGVPAGEGPAWYRGRPLPPARYAELAAALADRGRTLLTGPGPYEAVHAVRAVPSAAAPAVRVWWVDGVPVLTTSLLPDAGPGNPPCPVPDLRDVVRSVRESDCRFLTTDLARAADGAWQTVSVGDGQTGGLGPVTDAETARLFEALTAAGEGFPLALTAGRLTLRALPPAECARLADGGTAGLTWVDGEPPGGTVEGAGIMVQLASAGLYRPGWGTYAVTRTDDGVALGGIGFHGPPDETGTAELGYDLSPSARGAGWATDAVRLLASWAAARPEVRTLRAATEPANLPSQRVLERSGFVRVGEESEMHVFAYTGSGNGAAAGERGAVGASGPADGDRGRAAPAVSAGTRPPS
ncbi:GNAT family N-acetyltransferase [Streptomyces sclerotialus]|uniref:GNAT family N-acetyltransferase n=1 Tax=Streptomyces sclerotialus TaxID=1957 RepID=UPI0007C56948